MADALGTGGNPSPVSAVDHRLDQAGLIAPQTSTTAVRTGVMAGPGSTTVVTGTSATGTMTVNVASHHWVSTRGVGDGVYLGTKESSTTVNIAAAPGSNSRIDVVYSKQNDASSSLSPDGTSTETYGVAQGTAGASPTKPSIPVGAVELATVQVAAGATSTNGAGVTITNTALQTVARGAPVPCRNQAERDALTGYLGLVVERLDTGYFEKWRSAGVWTQFRPYATNNAGTSGVMAGTAPPAGTPLLTKTWFGTLAGNAQGDGSVTFPGGAFANGLVAVSITPVPSTAAGPYMWVPWGPTLSSVNARCYQFGSSTAVASPSLVCSVVAIGW